tara:strand:+ start:9164 stop:9421 length:258 start_codon:yes stop_codon:yes gene_type:complete
MNAKEARAKASAVIETGINELILTWRAKIKQAVERGEFALLGDTNGHYFSMETVQRAISILEEDSFVIKRSSIDGKQVDIIWEEE